MRATGLEEQAARLPGAWAPILADALAAPLADALAAAPVAEDVTALSTGEVTAVSTDEITGDPAAVDAEAADTDCLLPALVLLLDAAERTVITRTAGLDEDIAAAARRALHRSLARQLTRTAARTLVYELHASGLEFAAFLDRTATPAGLRALLTSYPVLAERLGAAAENTVAALAELAQRLQADRAALGDLLPAGDEPGEAVDLTVLEIRPGSGDAHRGGRSVAMVRLAGGTVVYKPRPLEAAGRVAGFFALLASRRPDLALRAPQPLCRDGYGWERFVAPAPCDDDAALVRFYVRHGALLALMYVLDATDLHCQNVIADGEFPTVIDAETLFHPTLVTDEVAADPAAVDHRDSVLRTGLLPLLVRGEHGLLDLSALCGGRTARTVADVVRFRDAGTSRMRLERTRGQLPEAGNVGRGRDGAPCEPDAAHLRAVAAGFRAAYLEIMACREELSALVAACAPDEVRVVLRPTQLYATLLDEVTHPELMRDPVRYAEALAGIGDEHDHPVLRALAAAEAADLRRGDVPLFAVRAGELEVRGSEPGSTPALLPISGIDRARRRLAGIDAADLQRQLWYLEASFAGRGEAIVHQAVPRRGPHAGARPIDPEHLLSQASALGDELLSTSRGDVGGRVNWVGVEPTDGRHWELRPMGAGLADGYTGVAVFLADLGNATGISRYHDHALAALTPVDGLLDRLEARPELALAVGDDPLTGLAGMHTAFAHLADAMDLPAAAAWRDRCAELRRSLPPVDPPPPGRDATWCLGVPALVTAGSHGADAARLLARVRAVGPLEQHSLCHGELGVLETLRLSRLAGEAGPDPAADLDAAVESLRRARLAALLGEIVARGVRCGTGTAVRTPGLLHGLAGIGLGLINQAAACAPGDVRVPSFDLLRATRPERPTPKEST